jgi:hypothetical protein
MKVYKNILSKKERLKLLKFIKTKIIDFGPNHPGLQSGNNLHEYKELKFLLNKIKNIISNYKIKTCWANQSNGQFICWHQHPGCDKTMVYYLKNKSNMGTMFKLDNSYVKRSDNYYDVKVTKGLENSLVFFNSDLVHSVPCHLPEERYSIAFELIEK